jgi:hypothetical protein
MSFFRPHFCRPRGSYLKLDAEYRVSSECIKVTSALLIGADVYESAEACQGMVCDISIREENVDNVQDFKSREHVQLCFG